MIDGIEQDQQPGDAIYSSGNDAYDAATSLVIDSARTRAKTALLFPIGVLVATVGILAVPSCREAFIQGVESTITALDLDQK